MDTGNKHKKLVKVALVVPEISSRTDRHTHRQTDRHTHHNHDHNTSQSLPRVK